MTRSQVILNFRRGRLRHLERLALGSSGQLDARSADGGVFRCGGQPQQFVCSQVAQIHTTEPMGGVSDRTFRVPVWTLRSGITLTVLPRPRNCSRRFRYGTRCPEPSSRSRSSENLVQRDIPSYRVLRREVALNPALKQTAAPPYGSH
jgi:hypothetical protein